MMPFTLIQ